MRRAGEDIKSDDGGKSQKKLRPRENNRTNKGTDSIGGKDLDRH